jgi:hypothetical protein
VQIPPSVLKRRLIQAAVLISAVVLLPELAAMFLPSVAAYVPPGLLSLLLIVSFGYAAIVWRTQDVVSWLFRGYKIQMPVRSAREEAAANWSAWIGVVVSSALLCRWMWGVL